METRHQVQGPAREAGAHRHAGMAGLRLGFALVGGPKRPAPCGGDVEAGTYRM